MKRTAIMAALLVLAGCSGAEPSTPMAETVTTTETATATETETATETVTKTVAPKATTAANTSRPTSPKTPKVEDLTETFLDEHGREIWSGHIVEVTRSGDSIVVRTTVVDPRGGVTGSPQAEVVLDICREVVDDYDPRTVKVMESNDTTFAHAGIDGPGCVEY